MDVQFLLQIAEEAVNETDARTGPTLSSFLKQILLLPKTKRKQIRTRLNSWISFAGVNKIVGAYTS